MTRIEDKMTKKKADSPFETIQILKTDTARLMELAMDISEANGEAYRNPPPPATMINLAVDALQVSQLEKETIH